MPIMATQYVLLLIIMFLGIGTTGYFTAIHSVAIARATMSRDLQIALQQTADAAVTLAPTTGSQWTKTTDASSPVEETFQADLSQVLTGTPWKTVSIDVQAFQVYTPADIGQLAPWGYPGTTISGPGYYAEVTFPWKVLSFLPSITITVPEVMQANSLVEPGNVPPVWNPTS